MTSTNSQPYNLNGKTALVTGASRGIGREIALLLGSHGANIICVSRSQDELNSVVELIDSNGGKGEAISCDVSDKESFESVVKKTQETFGTIDILVNNAGITRDNIILRMKEEEWDDVISINLKSCYNTIRTISPLMLKNRFGRIINITSIIGIRGNPGQSNYAASKSGIIGLTKSIAQELGSRNITVNAVAPGYIETNMTENLSSQIKENLLNQIPLKRIGNPGDIAKVILFLASDEASYITGQVISVDGGLHM